MLIMTDQHAAHLLGCAGDEQVATPNLDALAAGGVRFTRAYTTFPLCVPARSSMVTGRYPHQLGVGGNQGDGLEPGRGGDSLGHLLHSAGYDCVFAGKWHARQPSASPADGFSVLAPFGDAGLAETSADWLRERAAAGPARPFFLTVSFDDPHSICELARAQHLPYGDVADAPVADTPNLPLNFGRHPYEPEAVRFEQAARASMYGTGEYQPDDWRRYRYAYRRLVERADANVGLVLDALAGSGLADDTVVVFTSDHGDGDAAHAWNQKTALYEECARVPLIVRRPGHYPAGQVCDEPVSVGLDLLPTLCAVAGVRPPEGLDGIDWGRLLSDADGHGGPAGHREVVVETRFERADPPLTSGRALITERYKYVVYSWGRNREQLHDLREDPGEMRNLAVESRYAPVLDEMRERLLAWGLRTDDAGFLKRLVHPSSIPDEVVRRIFEVPY
ncbi:sulfatase family protein [Dactylosporangium roseum]